MMTVAASGKQQVNVNFHAGEEHEKQQPQIAEPAQPPGVHGCDMQCG
ncbi:hypothetical protein GCM10025858_07630 [Alicyclobacillus sacchari]|nr:hypothetical protein GCM10025858_07630 [Alicyclobacillus sacchari]